MAGSKSPELLLAYFTSIVAVNIHKVLKGTLRMSAADWRFIDSLS